MKDVKELSAQEENTAQTGPGLRDEQSPGVGLERATMIDTAGASAVVPPGRSRNTGDVIFKGVVRAALGIFLLALVGIMAVLLSESRLNIEHSGLGFIFNDVWNPVENQFGAAPAILGTIIVATFSMLIAGVVGLAAAVYLVDFAPRWLREPVGFLIELLAYIPSVVYGLWGLLVMSPWLQQNVQPWINQNLGFIPFFHGPPYGVGLMAATLILSVMLLPLIVSLSREALLLVPDSQREAMLALGATRWEVLRHAVLPYARGAIFGAVILALGRALGETIAVAMTIGGSHRYPQSVFDQGYTLSSLIANEFQEAGSPLFLSVLIESGLILFAMTAIVNVLAFLLLRRMNRRSGSLA